MRQLHIYISFIICAALVILHGCAKCEVASEQNNASLQIILDAPSYKAVLKSVSSNPSSPETWTTWERAVDGRFLYRVTAFILQGNRLVAHKDLSLDGEPEQTNIDFEANFTHGAYTLMVVANYSAFEAEDGSNGTVKYDGLSGFTTTVEEILSHNTIENFTTTYSDSFLNFQITSENGICKRVPQPLTLVKDIELHPGTNVITGELLRTCSRIRIAVENNSDEDLKLYSMNFTDAFTQTKAYLFNGRGYPGEKIAPDVSSTNALTPFSGTGSSPMVIPAKDISVVFDAYMLESGKNSSDNYTYSLGMSYNQMNSYILSSTTPIKKRSGIKSGTRYLIYSRGSSKYLTSGSSKVTLGTLGTLKQGMSIAKEYVWSFESSGSNKYYIGTAEALNTGQTAYYIANPTSGSSVTLGANKSVYFTASDKNSYISFQSSGSGNYRYLYSSGNSIGGQNSNSTTNALFELYQVEAQSISDISVPVRTINTSTGQAEEVEQINRNDFINAVLKVSYSKNKGHFIYEVIDWNTGGGDVGFN